MSMGIIKNNEYNKVAGLAEGGGRDLPSIWAYIKNKIETYFSIFFHDDDLRIFNEDGDIEIGEPNDENTHITYINNDCSMGHQLIVNGYLGVGNNLEVEGDIIVNGEINQIGTLANLTTTAKTDLVSAINEVTGTEKTYTAVYFFNGQVFKDTSLSSPFSINIGAYLDSVFPNTAQANAVYKEILKTLLNTPIGKPFIIYSSNIDQNYGGSVRFALSGFTGFEQKGTYSDDEDNPSSRSDFVTQSIAFSVIAQSSTLRIVEQPAGGGNVIYLQSTYRVSNDSCSISMDNSATPPYIALIIEN